jgi:hypothetical protein
MNDDKPSPSAVYLTMGYLTGMLSQGENYAALVESLRTGRLYPMYVENLRDLLDRALDDAGKKKKVP